MTSTCDRVHHLSFSAPTMVYRYLCIGNTQIRVDAVDRVFDVYHPYLVSLVWKEGSDPFKLFRLTTQVDQSD